MTYQSTKCKTRIRTYTVKFQCFSTWIPSTLITNVNQLFQKPKKKGIRWADMEYSDEEVEEEEVKVNKNTTNTNIQQQQPQSVLRKPPMGK